MMSMFETISICLFFIWLISMTLRFVIEQKRRFIAEEKLQKEYSKILQKPDETMKELQSVRYLLTIQYEYPEGFSDIHTAHYPFSCNFEAKYSGKKDEDGANYYTPMSEKESGSGHAPFIVEEPLSKMGLAYSSRISDIESTVSNILHITRTPLSGIKIASNDIRKLTDDDRIHKQCKELTDLANMIEEEISVFLQKPLQNNDKTEDLSSRIIHDCDMIKLASDKRINIRYELPKEKYMIPVDKANCIMMCSNCILENAMYYTSDNGLIDIELVIDDDDAEYSITNYGPPIDQKNIDKIFLKGFSCKGSSGAGLYLAKTVANQCLNADIIVKNNSENGVTFTMVMRELL